MTKKKITKSILPKLKLLDTEQRIMHRNEILSSFVQTHFSIKDGLINILEAGCGQKWPLDLADIDYKLTGVDISKEALEIRKENEGDLDRTIVDDLRNVKLDREEFDIVYCRDVLEHINGAEQVLTNFFKWLKNKGLIIVMFPDRDSVFGFITRFSPHWIHILYRKYILKFPNAGKPGFAPFPTYYDKIVSRYAFHDYCKSHGHNIVLEYGFPLNWKKTGWLAPGIKVMLKIFHYLSFGKLAADYGGLVYIIEKQ